MIQDVGSKFYFLVYRTCVYTQLEQIFSISLIGTFKMFLAYHTFASSSHCIMNVHQSKALPNMCKIIIDNTYHYLIHGNMRNWKLEMA
jgi:hypothetical protein